MPLPGVAERVYDLSVLKSLEGLSNPELPYRVGIVCCATIALAAAFGDWRFAIWFAVYVASLGLYLWFVQGLPKRAPLSSVLLIGLASFTVSTIFGMLGMYLWTLEDPIGQPISLILLMATMVHTHTGRAQEPILLLSDMISIFVLIVLRIGWLFAVWMPGRDTFILSFSLCACFTYFVVISLDVARTHRALQAAREQEVMNAKFGTIGRLAAGFAHDFNNILQAVMGNVELARVAEQVEERDSHLAEAAKAAHRGSDLTSRLLDLSRKATHSPEIFDTHGFLDDLRDRSRRIMSDDIKMHWWIEPNLPMLNADRDRLLRALENLLRNAAEAMEQGGTVQVAASAADGLLRVVVADEGRGIDAALRDLVFDPYFSTKPRSLGAGLGLSEARGIIEQAGGRIHLVSAPGEGTTVTVEVPVA